MFQTEAQNSKGGTTVWVRKSDDSSPFEEEWGRIIRLSRSPPAPGRGMDGLGFQSFLEVWRKGRLHHGFAANPRVDRK